MDKIQSLTAAAATAAVT